MRYIVSAEAEADLEEIGDYVALDNPERADTFIEEIREIARVLHGARKITRLFQP